MAKPTWEQAWYQLAGTREQPQSPSDDASELAAISQLQAILINESSNIADKGFAYDNSHIIWLLCLGHRDI